MARIRSFSQTQSESNAHPTETDALWSLVGPIENRLLQISTYGSDARASRPKVSQTIQFNREQAILLKRAIEEAFPGL